MIKQPRLETNRLVLRELASHDLMGVHALHTDPVVQRFLSRQPPKDTAATLAFIQKIRDGVVAGRWYYWGLFSQAKPNQIIGTICLWQFNDERTTAEVGFDLLPSQHGQGLMTEALRTILQFAEEQLQLHTISGLVHAENAPCIQLLIKHKFQFARELTVEEKFTAERDLPILCYERLRE